MTAKETKELSLEVWEYLKDHPKIYSKYRLPEDIYCKINMLFNMCPLCEYFKQDQLSKPQCLLCPLKYCDYYSYYENWSFAKTNKTRKKYAIKIYEAINNWDITNLD